MSDEELIIKAPHTQEVDGELIPDFSEAPRTYNDITVQNISVPIDDEDYKKLGVEYRKRAKEAREYLEKKKEERITSDVDKKMIYDWCANLTEKQIELLYIIRSFQWEERYSPSAWELARIFGVTTRNARYHIENLVKKGYLEMSPHRKSRHYMKRILFPKGMWWPWHDWTQFPPNVFWDKNEDKYKEMSKLTKAPTIPSIR